MHVHWVTITSPWENTTIIHQFPFLSLHRVPQQNVQIQTVSQLHSNIFTSLLTGGTRFKPFRRKNAISVDLSPLEEQSWPTLCNTPGRQPGQDRYIYSIMRSFYSVHGASQRVHSEHFHFPCRSISGASVPFPRGGSTRGVQLCFNFKRRVSNQPASILVTKCRAARKYAPTCFNRSFFFRKPALAIIVRPLRRAPVF